MTNALPICKSPICITSQVLLTISSSSFELGCLSSSSTGGFSVTGGQTMMPIMQPNKTTNLTKAIDNMVLILQQIEHAVSSACHYEDIKNNEVTREPPATHESQILGDHQ